MTGDYRQQVLELAAAGYGYEDIQVKLGLLPRRGCGKWIRHMVLRYDKRKILPPLRRSPVQAEE